MAWVYALLRFLYFLQAALDTPAKNQLGAQPIHWACVNGHVAVVDILLQVKISSYNLSDSGKAVVIECLMLISKPMYFLESRF